MYDGYGAEDQFIYHIGGDPLTQLIYVNYFWGKFCLQINADSEKMNGKYFVGDPLMQSSEHSSLSTALVSMGPTFPIYVCDLHDR